MQFLVPRFCCFISPADYLLLLPSVDATIGMAHGTCLICILMACMLSSFLWVVCGSFLQDHVKTQLTVTYTMLETLRDVGDMIEIQCIYHQS
jgi:uncharacterized membrane protein